MSCIETFYFTSLPYFFHGSQKIEHVAAVFKTGGGRLLSQSCNFVYFTVQVLNLI
jgi:hypothetical protein